MKIGTDIVEIARIQNALERFGDRFKRRFLTSYEIEKTIKVESLAGLWAAKEAIAKALGCGIGQELRFCDIEIFKDSRGSPQFRLGAKTGERFPIIESSLSISHDGGFAIAVVIIRTK